MTIRGARDAGADLEGSGDTSVGAVGSLGQSSRARREDEARRVLPSNSLPPLISKPLRRHSRQLRLSQSLRSSNILHSERLAGEPVDPADELESNEVSLDLSDRGAEVRLVNDQLARRHLDAVGESLAREVEVDKGGGDIELEAGEPDHGVRGLVGHVEGNHVSSLDTLRDEVVGDTAGA